MACKRAVYTIDFVNFGPPVPSRFFSCMPSSLVEGLVRRSRVRGLPMNGDVLQSIAKQSHPLCYPALLQRIDLNAPICFRTHQYTPPNFSLLRSTHQNGHDRPWAHHDTITDLRIRIPFDHPTNSARIHRQRQNPKKRKRCIRVERKRKLRTERKAG